MILIRSAQLLDQPDITPQLAQLCTEMRLEGKRGYETPYGFLATPYDDEARKAVTTCAERVLSCDPELVVVVGIGGSSVGAKALIEGLSGMSTRRVIFFDTIDDRCGTHMLNDMRAVLARKKNVLVCLITKSGTTSETIINGALAVELLKKHYGTSYTEHLVIITDAESALQRYAHEHKIACLEIPAQVGGRYSVFTPVGLFPLACAGIDGAQLCAGARTIVEQVGDPDSDAVRAARALYVHYQADFREHNLFVFAPYLESLGQWYKQLIGESLGKQETTDGVLIEAGITPFVSVGTVDLHSVVQLYLGGPRTCMTSFITVEKEPHTLTIPDNDLAQLIPGMAGRSVTQVKSAIIKGVLAAYELERRPYMHSVLAQTPEAYGAFMMSKMVETVLLGNLMQVNPFDQPAVELYKTQTRAVLAHAKK